MSISLIATSHGTSVSAAREAVSALVDAVRDALRGVEVLEAYVDVELPQVGTVVDQVAGHAVVVPLLLAPGFHVRVDVEGAADRPWAVAADTLGPDDRLTDVMLARLAAAGADHRDVVVLGAAGSTDAGARRSIERSAHLLGVRWGAAIPVGYVGGTGTPLTEVVDAAARSGRRVVVVSHLLAPGFFHDRLTRCGADVVTRPLLDGPDVPPEMVSLVLERFGDAAARLGRASAASAVAR